MEAPIESSNQGLIMTVTLSMIPVSSVAGLPASFAAWQIDQLRG
jgi:hypothetical protein